MKIKPEHYQAIKAAFAEIAPTITAHREALRTNPKVNDLEKRLRWDAIYATLKSKWVCDNIYPYANDTHLDTALRNAIAELGI